MARLFLTQREFDFFSDICKETIKDISGQSVYYFPVNYQKSDVNTLYQEAVEKSFDNVIYIPAVVEYEGTTKPELNSMGLSKNQTIKVHLHKRDMDDKGITPSEGDFVQFGGINFEVQLVVLPGIQYGHAERAYWYNLTCEQSDEGVFAPPMNYPPTNLEQAKVADHFTQLRGEPEYDVRSLQEGPVGKPITGVKSSPFDDDVNDDS